MGCFSSILFPGKIKITTHVFSASALAGSTSHIQFGFFFSKEFLGINSTFRLGFFFPPTPPNHARRRKTSKTKMSLEKCQAFDISPIELLASLTRWILLMLFSIRGHLSPDR